jgi:hypothetical protein
MNEQLTRRPATYQDVLDAPPNMVAELVRGALHLHPRPASLHAFAESSLSDEIVSPFQKGRGGPGGWWIVFEPELHLGEDVLVPDLAGWRRERMPSFRMLRGSDSGRTGSARCLARAPGGST